MKNYCLKLCCFIIAAMMLFTSCNNTTNTDTSDSTAKTTESSDSTETTAGSETTETTESTGDTYTTGNPDSQETTSSTESPLPVVDPTKYDETFISEDELYDKIMGGWLGQMIGVAWTAKTEFAAQGSIMSTSRFSAWTSDMIDEAYIQDDVYVEIPFLVAMNENGVFCDPLYMAEKFTDSLFNLWHANAAARNNLRAGYYWYDCGNYLINGHADDIDWQIECDFLGALYPGLVNEAAERAFEIGHMICYGDGVYGGVFVTAMHAAAYTADSIEDIVKAGLSVIPEGTKFRDLLDEVMAAYQAGKTWEETWQIVEDTCGKTDKCVDFCTTGSLPSYNIDAKLNAAYVMIGLLWGEGDFAKTVEISCRCGQDSDCNPSSAASVLGNYYGASGIEEIYKSNVNYDTTLFAETAYTLNDVVEMSMNLAKEVMAAYGGSENNGEWTIKTNKAYETVAFEQWPDDFGADVIVKLLPNGVVNVQTLSYGEEKISSVCINMGDGTTLTADGKHAYGKTGSYTLSYTIVGDKGTEIKGEKTIKVETVPQGKGITSAGDNDIVFDGTIAYNNADGRKLSVVIEPESEGADVWAGIQFDQKYTINGLKFTEGVQNKKGGWFAESPRIEVLIDDAWVTVEAIVSPDYVTEQNENGFWQYRFTFDEVTCEGIRIVGKAGGSDPYVSVGELIPRTNGVSVITEFN